jgi:hypothetical protein
MHLVLRRCCCHEQYQLCATDDSGESIRYLKYFLEFEAKFEKPSYPE